MSTNTKNIKIPSVPFDTISDIPFVPNPYSGVTFQMGGIIPSHNYYEVDSPHSQNSLTPFDINNIYSINYNNVNSSEGDWVRGNQFGVKYNSSIINDRVNNKTYVNDYPFYNSTVNEYPTLKYPYKTMQLSSRNSRNSNKLIPTNDIGYSFDIIDNFSNFFERNSCILTKFFDIINFDV